MQQGAQAVRELGCLLWAQQGRHCSIKLAQHLLCDRTELPPAMREIDALGAPVGRVRPTHDEPMGFQGRHQRGQGLLAQVGTPSELTQLQAILLPQGQQDGAERGADLGVAQAAEGGSEELVPALRRLREQEPEVVAAEQRLGGPLRRRRATRRARPASAAP